MREITNECVGCGLPCLGDSCSNAKVIRYYCDECKSEFEADELYVNDDEEELCENCLKDRFKTVAQLEREGAYDD